MNSWLFSLLKMLLGNRFRRNLRHRGRLKWSVSVLVIVLEHFRYDLRMLFYISLDVSEFHGALIFLLSNNPNSRLEKVLAVWRCWFAVELALLRNGARVAISQPMLDTPCKAVLVHDVDCCHVAFHIGCWDNGWALDLCRPDYFGADGVLIGLFFYHPFVFVQFDRLDLPERVL